MDLLLPIADLFAVNADAPIRKLGSVALAAELGCVF
jgi:hypothetical protein